MFSLPILAALAVVTLGMHLIVIVGLGAADLARGMRRASASHAPIVPAAVEPQGVHD